MTKATLIKAASRSLFFLGSWPVRFISWWVATGYFLFLPTRRRNSFRLYQVIFPERRGWYHLYCAWRQFHSFAAAFGDRIDADRKKEKLPPTPGREGILEANKKGSGGILLMSHLGSSGVAG